MKIHECALSMEIALHKMFADVNQDMLESCVNTQFVSESNQTTKQSATVLETALSQMYVHVNMDTVDLTAMLFKHALDMSFMISMFVADKAPVFVKMNAHVNQDMEVLSVSCSIVLEL